MTDALAAIHNIADMRSAARRALPRGLFEFVDRGSEDELTMRANREGFERLRLVPRVLVNVSGRTKSTELFGQASALPMVVAPTGAAGLMCFEGEVAIARAAAKAGIPFTLSTYSINSMEQVAEKAGAGCGSSSTCGPTAPCRTSWCSAPRRPASRP